MIIAKTKKGEQVFVIKVYHYIFFEVVNYKVIFNANFENLYDFCGTNLSAIKLINRFKDECLTKQIIFDESDIGQRRIINIELQIFNEILEQAYNLSKKLSSRYNIHLNIEDASKYNSLSIL